MKKYYLKLLPIAFLILSVATFSSCSDKGQDEIENIISVKDLPSAAQNFLNKYFSGYSVNKVEKDIEDNIIIYEVSLQDGYEVIFNSYGEWTQVEAPFGKSIPTGFIPSQVMATLNDRFPYYGVNEINTTGQGYKVELNDNQGGESIDVYFDMSGEIIKIDQMEY